MFVLSAKKLFSVHVLDTRDGKRKVFKREYRSLDELRQRLEAKYPYLTILEVSEIQSEESELSSVGVEASETRKVAVVPSAAATSSLDVETSASQSNPLRFKVLGSNRATGSEVEIVLDAVDLSEAHKIAEQMGISVSGIMPEASTSESEISIPVVTTQQTSKLWKMFMVVGAVFIFTGFGLLFTGRTGLEWGIILWLLGAATYGVGRVGKSWFHE